MSHRAVPVFLNLFTEPFYGRTENTSKAVFIEFSFTKRFVSSFYSLKNRQVDTKKNSEHEKIQKNKINKMGIANLQKKKFYEKYKMKNALLLFFFKHSFNDIRLNNILNSGLFNLASQVKKQNSSTPINTA